MMRDKRATRFSVILMLGTLAVLLCLLCFFFTGRALAQPFAPTVTPTMTPTSLANNDTADNGTIDLGTITVPAGLTQSVNIVGLDGWNASEDDDESNIQWRWEGTPIGMVITHRSTFIPFKPIFYLTPSATTAVGAYNLTLYGINNKNQWKMQLLMNVTDCQETFQPGTYTLSAAANAASTYFSFGGPDAWRGGLGDQRWFTFCASSQTRQLTITLLSATGQTDKFNLIPTSISFYRIASWPLQPLAANPLTYYTADSVTGDLAPDGTKIFTWTVQPGAYVAFFLSDSWGQRPDPSVTLTYSTSLS